MRGVGRRCDRKRLKKNTQKKRKNSEESGRCPLLPSVGAVAGQNRSDAGFIAAERPSRWGRDGGKSPGCHFALIRRRSTAREARERRQTRVRSRERK